MDNHPSTPPPITYSPPPPKPGLFGTGIPSSVAFVVAILLFFLPFTEIKCSGSTFMTKSGLGYALGQEWKVASGFGSDLMKEEKTTKKEGDKDPATAKIFILAAAGLGILGLLSVFARSKAAAGFGIFAGVLAGGALIAFMVEMKKWFNDSMAKQATEKISSGDESSGLDKLGNTLNNLTFGFTPWFYVAIIAFFAAAFFSYKRMTSLRN
ncbi:MAG: hypothetical protein U0U70_02595 [Chitinophagaceae bacterium]